MKYLNTPSTVQGDRQCTDFPTSGRLGALANASSDVRVSLVHLDKTVVLPNGSEHITGSI